MELLKSWPYALSAYIVIGTVLSFYFGTIVVRRSKVKIQMEHLENLSKNEKSE